jgi:hypothetical protein
MATHFCYETSEPRNSEINSASKHSVSQKWDHNSQHKRPTAEIFTMRMVLTGKTIHTEKQLMTLTGYNFSITVQIHAILNLEKHLARFGFSIAIAVEVF